MAYIVQKFGGTSVATLDRIKHVAEIIAKSYQKDSVVAVVSAMAGVTNKFVGYVHNLNSYEGDPEYDSVISSGEIVTAGLLSIALKNLGISARSYTAWQLPIHTDDHYGSAVIQHVDATKLEQDISNGIVPVVCGFQGTSSENRVTTLGRGGSDLTAVAVSDALRADLCEIYSDVDGVYTVDPNLYPNAKRLKKISFEEMLEMSMQGAKVLQAQSVDYARNKQVKIRVASSFVENEGTIICAEQSSKKVCGLAVTYNLSSFKVQNKFSAEEISDALSKNFIRGTMIKQNGKYFSILVDRNKKPAAYAILKKFDNGVRQEIIRGHLSRVSVIGRELSHDYSEKLREHLLNHSVEIFYCYTDGYSINLVVSTSNLLKSIEVLHKFCDLENE